MAGQDVQNRVEDDESEEQDALDEDEEDAEGKGAALGRASSEEIVVHDAVGGALPLVDAKGDKSDEAGDQGSQDDAASPLGQFAALVERHEEQG